MTQPPPDPFASADFYSCDADCESLHHTEVEEAIEEQVDFDLLADRVGGDAQTVKPVTVYAFKTRAVDDDFVEACTEELIERLVERFGDALGNPDGEPGDEFARRDVQELRLVLAPRIGIFLRSGKVWACDNIAERVFTAKQVETMMRHRNPEWFEKKDSGSKNLPE